MKSGFSEEELRNIKNKKILKILGFVFDSEYDLIVLNGAGAWIGNVLTKDISLSNVEEGSKIDWIIKNGGVVTISHPLPLDNGKPLSTQKGVYCANYKDMFLPKEAKVEEEVKHSIVV